MPANLEYFPQEFIDLAKEVQYHHQIKLNAGDDFEIKLAKIAAYCGIVLDGVYTFEDQKEIARRLTEILFKSRYSLIS